MPSGNAGTGGGIWLSFSLLKRRINPLFLFLSVLTGGSPGGIAPSPSAGSESRLSNFGWPTMLCRALFAFAPALIERPRDLDATCGEDGDEVLAESLLLPGKGVVVSKDEMVATPVSVVVRIRWALLASSKEISVNGVEEDRSVQPGRCSTPGTRSRLLPLNGCAEPITDTGEDILFELMGEDRSFDPNEFIEASGINVD